MTIALSFEHQIGQLSRKLHFNDEGNAVPDDVIRATEAARQLGISTNDLLRLVSQHEIRYVMIGRIAHLPRDAVSEYRARIS